MGECLIFSRGGAISLYDPTFANNEWSKIIQACQRNTVPDTWAVGDQKAMTINGTEYSIDIIGKNHDTYSDGSGTAPLTFQLHEVYSEAGAMAAQMSTVGWQYTTMYSTTLPNFLFKMPSEVQDAVKSVNKITTRSTSQQFISVTQEMIFILSATELMGDTSTLWESSQGTQYEYYSSGGSMGKYKLDGSQATHWTRSVSLNGSTNFITRTLTSYSSNSYNVNLYYAPAFCF